MYRYKMDRNIYMCINNVPASVPNNVFGILSFSISIYKSPGKISQGHGLSCELTK